MDDFPYHLEKQFEKLYLSILRRYTRPIRNSLVEVLKEKKFKTDAKDERPSQDQERKINILLASFGLLNLTDKEKSKLENFFKILSSYTFAKSKSAIEELKKGRTKSKQFFPSIILDQESRTVQSFQESYVKFNQELVQDLGKEWIEGVSQTIGKGFVQGTGTKTLIGELLNVEGVQESKAAFWARDQLGDAYSNFTETRFKEAGISGYVWMTSQDNRVRDSHANLHGRFFTMNERPPGLTKPNAKLPGEDYNCRCRMKPAIDQTDELSEKERLKVINKINKERKDFKQPEVMQ